MVSLLAVGVDDTAPFYGIYDGPGLFLWQGGTAPAAAQFVIFAQMVWAGIGGAMHHDGTFAGIAVFAGAEPIQPQGVAMLAQVGFCGTIDAEGALSGVELVGKALCG